MLSIGDSTTLYSFSYLHVEMWDFLRSNCFLLSKVLKRYPWASCKFLFPGMQIWVLIGSFFFLSLYWICYNIASALCFVFWLQGMWDLGSLTRDRTYTPAFEGDVLTIGPPGKSPDWLLKKKKMADDQLIGKHRRMKGTTQVMESGLLLLCLSPSPSFLWLPQWVHLCFSCCWGLRLHSRGAD